MLPDTTICAPATPPGGALAIIRISGPESFSVCEKIFTFPGNKSKLADKKPNTIHFGYIMDGEIILDEVMISLFHAPGSYTGEDSVEITCHGSPYIQKRILELLIKNGCISASPGEFTQRSFLNGKLELSQAEAVADLIASESMTAHRIAINQMRFGIAKGFKELRHKLLNFTSLIELELDFSDEDVEFAKRPELKNLVTEILNKASDLRDSFTLGNAIKNGVPVAIVGKPNVGKSTLLNRLLKDEKAIVSEIAGTTRDAIEDTIIIDGIMFRFIDTAGIHETADIIENLGIRKTYQKVKMASMILLLADARDEPDCIINSLSEIRKQTRKEAKQLILIINKTDLVNPGKLELILQSVQLMENENIIPISAISGYNLDKLISQLKSVITREKIAADKIIISNIRHLEALNETINSLQRVSNGLSDNLPEDLLAQDLRQAVYFLGTITGEVTTDEILGNIFKNFCIGK